MSSLQSCLKWHQCVWNSQACGPHTLFCAPASSHYSAEVSKPPSSHDTEHWDSFPYPSLLVLVGSSLHERCFYSRAEANLLKSSRTFQSSLSAYVIQPTLSSHPSFPWGYFHLIQVVSVASHTSMGGMVLVSLGSSFHLFGDLFLNLKFGHLLLHHAHHVFCSFTFPLIRLALPIPLCPCDYAQPASSPSINDTVACQVRASLPVL